MFICSFFAPFLASRSGRFGPKTAWQLLLRGCIRASAFQIFAGLEVVALGQSLRLAPAAVDFAARPPHLMSGVAVPLVIWQPFFMPTFGHG